MIAEKDSIIEWFKQLQNDICKGLEALDGKGKFVEDAWGRTGGGGGFTRILENGDLIEKGGVNFSAVHGALPENIKNAIKVDGYEFLATGVSIVLHPHNPFVPVIHMNVRYFEISNGTWWFGGGIDVTPHYFDAATASIFHRMLKQTCDRFHHQYYHEFKKWADDYFFIKHRKEIRGIGGIFFDRLSNESGLSKEDRFAFVRAVGETFLPAYTAVATPGRNRSFGSHEKEWQHLRRGRYVEFNLVYDKGTKFGLDTEGRTESILMSLPSMAAWKYNHTPEPGSAEENTVKMLKKGIDFIDLE